MMCVRRFVLDGIDNFRDLGGFITTDGKITRYNVFYRSESLFGLKDRERNIIVSNGVHNCIDVHGPIDASATAHPFQNDPRCKYYCFPVLSDIIVHSGSKNDFFQEKDWINVNTRMMEKEKDWVRNVINACAKTEGGTVIHCRTGKSRTSLICMIIMLLAKVPKVDIIAEFSTTDVYMGEKYKNLLNNSFHGEGFYRSPAFVMEETINYLINKYCSIEEYLDSCKVSVDSMKAICQKYISDESW